MAVGLKLTDIADSNYFHNNFILGEDTVTTTLELGLAVRWDRDADTSNYTSQATRFYQNHIEGTRANFDFSISEDTITTTFVNCFEDTIVKSSVSTASYHTFGITNIDRSNIIRDCVFSGGAAKDDIVIYTDGGVRVEWTITVQTGNDGDSVWAIDQHSIVYPGGLTASGSYDIVLPEFTDDFTSDTTFSPYTIYASGGTGTDDSVYTVAGKATVVMSLAGGSPSNNEINSSFNCSFGSVDYEEMEISRLDLCSCVRRFDPAGVSR